MRKVLDMIGKPFSEIGIISPTRQQSINTTREILQELSYNSDKMLEYVVHHEPLLNKDQRVVYQEVLRRLYNNEFGVIFIDATGGTAKTFLINMLIARIRKENKIALAVASSGIAATLITGGRTAHSTLRIPMDLIHNEAHVCNIKKGSENAKLLQDSQALFWNEITFTNCILLFGLHLQSPSIIRKVNHSQLHRLGFD